AGLELQQQALPQVAGADAGGVELLDDPQHLLRFGEREELRLLVPLGFDRVLLEQLVGTAHDLLGRGAEITVLGDVADELFGEQLLLEMLLQVEQRHVQQIHRLVQAGIDAQVLAQPDVLVQAGLHAAGVSRARRRAVRVGPKYRLATRSSNTSSRTVPETCTLPSNMM